MNNKPLISIITPVWNGLPFLKECIESVLMQEVQEWEMLVSDDGSTDGSREYLRTLNDSRIKIFEQKKNLGIFGNLNFIFDKAQSPICQLLCQDDYFTKDNSLELILSYWVNASTSIGFVRFNHANEHNHQLVAFQKKYLPRVVDTKTSALMFYVFGNIPGNLSNVSLRTEIVKMVGKFNETLPYAGDFDFWLRAAQKMDMGVQDDSITYVRSHDKQASKYLNYDGELVSQKNVIANHMFSILECKYPKYRSFLKIHGTLQYDSLDRDLAIKSYLRGNKKYLEELNRFTSKANFSFNKLSAKWLLFALSIGGRLFRITSAKLLLFIALK